MVGERGIRRGGYSEFSVYPEIRDFLKKTTNKNYKVLRVNSPLERGQIVENVSEFFPANNGGVNKLFTHFL